MALSAQHLADYDAYLAEHAPEDPVEGKPKRLFRGAVIKGTQIKGPKAWLAAKRVEGISQTRFTQLMVDHPLRHLRSNGKEGGSRKWIVCRDVSKMPAAGGQSVDDGAGGMCPDPSRARPGAPAAAAGDVAADGDADGAAGAGGT
eukprot:gene37433-1155_t